MCARLAKIELQLFQRLACCVQYDMSNALFRAILFSISWTSFLVGLGPAHGEESAVEPLRSVLLREGGGAVFLTAGKGGLIAHAADATWQRPLVSEPIEAAALDGALDVVWLRRKGRLEAFDLRQPNPSLIPVLTQVPAWAFMVSLRDRQTHSGEIGHQYAVLNLWLGKKPSVDVSPGIYINEGCNGDPETVSKKVQREARRVKIIGADFLATLVSRKFSPPSTELEFLTDSRVNIPKALNQCDAGVEACGGQSVRFGKTGLVLVVTAHSCGDACYSGCLLFDSKSKQWAAPPQFAKLSRPKKELGAGSCGNYLFERSGRGYLLRSFSTGDDAVCTASGSCLPLKDEPLGWLDGGPVILNPGD